MLNVSFNPFMLSVNMLNVIMLNIVMLKVVAPKCEIKVIKQQVVNLRQLKFSKMILKQQQQ